VATQRRDGFTIEVVLHSEHLSDLLAPSFPDAACRDHIDPFDAAAGRPNRLEVASAREIALAICAQCLCLQSCSDWVDGLSPRQQPHGVIAGRVITKRSSRTPW